MRIFSTLIGIMLLCITSCKNNEKQADASGTFEATETIVSAEASGKILAFTASEGDELNAEQVLGYIDSTQPYLARLQLLQTKKTVLSGRPDTQAQLESLEKELDNAISDEKRMENLVQGDVASPKQLEDAKSRVSVLKAKIASQKSMLNTNTSTLDQQSQTIEVQLAQVEDQLKKCVIVNPVKGTVLETYVNPFEMTGAGKPLYKIADLSYLSLKAYITNEQYAGIKTGQKVKVSVDAEDGKSKTYDGVVEWISTRAEFTPKTIQTKNERANLVYAVKIKVKNDGLLKIGMYGEVEL